MKHQISSGYWLHGDTSCWEMHIFPYDLGKEISLDTLGLSKMVGTLQKTFLIHFLWWKFVIKISPNCDPKDSIKSALVHVMAWWWTKNKPLPEPMMTKFSDAIWYHKAIMSSTMTFYFTSLIICWKFDRYRLVNITAMCATFKFSKVSIFHRIFHGFLGDTCPAAKNGRFASQILMSIYQPKK